MLFANVQRSVRLNKKKKSTNTSPYPDEAIDRLARAFYPAILACWNSEEGQRSLVGARPLHLACARPFGRLKAPLGLSLLRCAAQTRTFENTLLSAACKKKKGELWQKERGLDGASPLDNFFKSETGYRTILSNRFCKRSNVSSSTVRKVRSDRKFKR